MHQELTIINSDKLFGDFSNLNISQNLDDVSKKYWEWPPELGNGFMSLNYLRPGLLLGLGEYRLDEEVSIYFGLKKPPVTIGFSISANLQSRGNGDVAIQDPLQLSSGRNYIFYLPEWQFMANFPKSVPIKTVCIYIDPPLLNTLFDEQQTAHIPDRLCDIMEGDDTSGFHFEIPTHPHVNTTIHQLFNCPYQHPLKRLYLESKVLELIAYSVSCLMASKNTHSGPCVLLADDIERVQAARDELVRNLESPPSLLQLARQVGINKNKLNQGFNHLFGTSAFEYLRIHRLERAKILLENRKMNVTEASLEVGYLNQRSFSRAFKTHFGTSPSDHLH